MKDTMFGLTIGKIPLVNLRYECIRNFRTLMDEEFRATLRDPRTPSRTQDMDWYGYKGTLLSHMLQRAILGIEAYIPGSVMFEYSRTRPLDDKVLKAIRNPFTLGRGTTKNYYHRLPSLVDDSYSLMAYDHTLYKITETFYTEVRNPIFHGHELDSGSFWGVFNAYKHILRLYEWIDSWHNPNFFGHDAVSRRRGPTRQWSRRLLSSGGKG